MAPRNRIRCDYCIRTYAYTTSLQNHMEAKHWAELVRDHPDKYSSAQEPSAADKAPHGPVGLPVDERDPKTSHETALRGAELVSDIAKQLRNADQHNGEKLARELEGLAFGLNFLFKDLQATDYWVVKEKATKWDKLNELLPSIEGFLKLALETEAKRVQTPDHD